MEGKVLNAIIAALKSKVEILDIMEMVNATVLGMSEIRFSETMYILQSKNLISGVEFEDNNPQKITMWDNIKVHLADFEMHN